MKVIFLLLLLVLYATPAYAQWTFNPLYTPGTPTWTPDTLTQHPIHDQMQNARYPGDYLPPSGKKIENSGSARYNLNESGEVYMRNARDTNLNGRYEKVK